MTPRNAVFLVYQDGLYRLIEAPSFPAAHARVRSPPPTGFRPVSVRYPGQMWMLETAYRVKLEPWTG